MISYWDKFSQVVVAQTLRAEEGRDYPCEERVHHLSYLMMIKSSIAHVDYVLLVNERDVDEHGVAFEIHWSSDTLPDVSASEEPLTSWVSDEDLIIDKRGMVGAFYNHGTTDEPSWGSHS
jgi:hypothetical protein